MDNKNDFNIDKADFQELFANISSRLTPVNTAPTGELQCRIFIQGLSDKLFLLKAAKEQGFIYALLGEDFAVILDYEEQAKHLTVPAQIAGRRVLAVSGLCDRDDIEKITVENGILQLCCGFLKNCPSIKTVILPPSLRHISPDVFDGSKNIEEFRLSGTGEEFSAEEGVLFNKSKQKLIRYPSGKPNKLYDIPKTVREIGANAFSGAGQLDKITVPETIESLGCYAFSGGAKHIALPVSLKKIGDRAFFMSNIESLEIPERVSYVGYQAFAYCPALKEIKLPEQLQYLGDFAFKECNSLELVLLPFGIQKLSGTFYECRALKHVLLPITVEEIDEWTFLRDDKKLLEGITFHGKNGSFAEKFAKSKGYEWIAEF